MKEIIYDPAAEWWTATHGESPRPKFHHCEVEHGPDLSSSENRIVNNLIVQGYAVHETISTFYLAFPAWMQPKGNCFVGTVRNEFQVNLDGLGYLRFRFDIPGELYLTLLYIKPEHQNKGHARRLFPKLTDDLLKAGASSLRGRVMPSMLPAKRRMDVPALSEFYRREAGFEILERGWIKKTSPCGRTKLAFAQASPNSDATDTRKASEIATIS